MLIVLLLLGFLAVPAPAVARWTQLGHVDVWLSLPFAGRDLVLTRQLFQVAGFLAAFTGLYFSVLLVTDDAYRRQFGDDVEAEIREVLAVHCAYRFEVDAAADG